MIDRRQLIFHLRATRFDAGVLLATAFAAVLVSIEFCIVIGVFLSFALYIPRAAQVRLTPLTATPERNLRHKHPSDPTDDCFLAVELDGELIFATEVELAKQFSAVVQSVPGNIRSVILALGRGRNPDATFLNQLRKLHEALNSRGVILLLCEVQDDMLASSFDHRSGPARSVVTGFSKPESPTGRSPLRFNCVIAVQTPPERCSANSDNGQ